SSAAAFLRKRIEPDPYRLDEKRFAKLLADLESAKFTERDAAARALAELGRPAEPALRAALAAATGAEARKRLQALVDTLSGDLTPNELRLSRAVQAMEFAGNGEARRVLKDWATGSPEAPLTRESRAALQRLK